MESKEQPDSSDDSAQSQNAPLDLSGTTERSGESTEASQHNPTESAEVGLQSPIQPMREQSRDENNPSTFTELSRQSEPKETASVESKSASETVKSTLKQCTERSNRSTSYDLTAAGPLTSYSNPSTCYDLDIASREASKFQESNKLLKQMIGTLATRNDNSQEFKDLHESFKPDSPEYPKENMPARNEYYQKSSERKGVSPKKVSPRKQSGHNRSIPKKGENLSNIDTSECKPRTVGDLMDISVVDIYYKLSESSSPDHPSSPTCPDAAATDALAMPLPVHPTCPDAAADAIAMPPPVRPTCPDAAAADALAMPPPVRQMCPDAADADALAMPPPALPTCPDAAADAIAMPPPALPTCPDAAADAIAMSPTVRPTYPDAAAAGRVCPPPARPIFPDPVAVARAMPPPVHPTCPDAAAADALAMPPPVRPTYPDAAAAGRAWPPPARPIFPDPVAVTRAMPPPGQLHDAAVAVSRVWPAPGHPTYPDAAANRVDASPSVRLAEGVECRVVTERPTYRGVGPEETVPRSYIVVRHEVPRRSSGSSFVVQDMRNMLPEIGAPYAAGDSGSARQVPEAPDSERHDPERPDPEDVSRGESSFPLSPEKKQRMH